MKVILAEKLGMSQIFDEKGNVIPITIVQAGPCSILQIKNKEKDGYDALQIGFKKIEKQKKIKKTMKGKEFKFLKEFRLEKPESDLKVNDEINVSLFQEGDMVKVSGMSKGKGFEGIVKRWHKGGRPATHGTKHEERAVGSIGSTFPERVIRGKKMPGRGGYRRVTLRSVKIVKVDQENNLIAIKGAIPGRNGILLEISG
jgi:large subunit ribosomal protein L3